MSKIIEEKGKFYYKNEDKIDYNNEVKEIRVCGCDDEYPVPLIWTFAFSGAEYWCPYCGENMGMMGAGEHITITKEILDRGNKYKELSKDFLHAKSTSACSSLIFKGERISPEDLPESEKKKNRKIINSWKYDIKLTDTE